MLLESSAGKSTRARVMVNFITSSGAKPLP